MQEEIHKIGWTSSFRSEVGSDRIEDRHFDWPYRVNIL